ncbi:MoxR family ATPase [Thiomonas sp. FB-6]|uniref:AAA family ATPase n=1 Tax=Thiomonas sp. FB-6 TaxID=1158291 RepID=UPI0003701A26|nr:MoxR family ATPase [Thiomonas sp. FB-6]
MQPAATLPTPHGPLDSAAAGNGGADPCQAAVGVLREQLAQDIVGQQALLDRLVVALLSGGHLLVEGLPGLAKTTAIKALARAVHASFQRVQFTPDLLPGDLTGGDVYLPAEGRSRFVEGPLFHDIVLADEINRAPAKVQSALLEAMQEGQVTVGGRSHALPPLFLVMATQNPLEQSGTYPLPEAQLDRFLLHVVLDYPSAEQERRILDLDLARAGEPAGQARAVIDAALVLQARRQVRRVHLAESLRASIVDLVRATREPRSPDADLPDLVEAGASPRAVLALAHAAQALAYLRGRDYVVPEDIVELAPDVLRHRIVLHPQARLQGVDADSLVRELLRAREIA